MSQGLTYEQAAAILGCHFSNVAKLIRKGDLTSTGKRGASLNREQVEALAERRAAERAARPPGHPASTSASTIAPTGPRVALPRQVAELLGVTRPAGDSRTRNRPGVCRGGSGTSWHLSGS